MALIIAKRPQEAGHTEALGAAAFLAMHSPVHRSWSLADAERLFVPPIKVNQGSLYILEGRYIGFVTWAFLNEEVADDFLSGRAKLMPQHWTGGQTPWIIDLLAPFGHVRQMVTHLRKEIFPGVACVQSVRRREDGQIRKTNLWWGSGAHPQRKVSFDVAAG